MKQRLAKDRLPTKRSIQLAKRPRYIPMYPLASFPGSLSPRPDEKQKQGKGRESLGTRLCTLGYCVVQSMYSYSCISLAKESEIFDSTIFHTI